MRRVLSALLLTALLAVMITLTPRQAVAGGHYYDDGPRYSSYRHYDDYERPYRRSYSSDCCYRRVSYYKRAYQDRPYYDRPYYRSSYYDRPYYRSSYYDRPYYDRPYYRARYYDDGWSYGRPYITHYSSYYVRPYSYYSSYDYGYRPYYGYSSWGSNYTPYTRAAWPYDQPRRYYPEGCRRSKVYDDAGGWVWGNGLSCGH